MEIQKIFSEIDTDEKLYSVLLSEEELALFSVFQKEFGKYDKSLAQKQGKTVAEIRIGRSGLSGTGTVNDVINARGGIDKNASSFMRGGHSFDNSMSKKLGYSNSNVQGINETRLEDFKDIKKSSSNKTTAYNNLSEETKRDLDSMKKHSQRQAEFDLGKGNGYSSGPSRVKQEFEKNQAYGPKPKAEKVSLSVSKRSNNPFSIIHGQGQGGKLVHKTPLKIIRDNSSRVMTGIQRAVKHA